jgi:Icc protein
MKFSFIQITDHHLGESHADHPYGYPAAETFRAVMDKISTDHFDKIDFIVSTGDLVNRATDPAYDFMKYVLDLKTADKYNGSHFIQYGNLNEFPFFLLPGNHDERATFFSNFFPGQPDLTHLNVWFSHKGIRFIMLDWGMGDRAELTPELLDFTTQALQTNEPCILLMHHNMIPLGTPWLDRFIADEIESFYDILRGKNILAVLCGHLHSSYDRTWEGIPVLGLRSTAFQFRFEGKPIITLQPPHYRLVTVSSNASFESRVVEVPLPENLVRS